MKADRIGLATILVMLTLVIVSEATGVQQTGETAALAPAASTSPTEMPQVQRDGLIEMRLESNPLTARVAEPIQIRLDVDAPEGSLVTPPIIGSALGQLEVVDRQWIQALPIDGDPKRRRWTLLLKLESIESGQFTVPPMEMLYRLPEDFSTSRSAQRSVRSKPFAIEVTSLLGEDQDPKAFRDIKAAIQTPQIEAPGNFNKWIALGIGLCTVASLGGYWWWRRDRTRIPFEWACGEVDNIETGLAASAIPLSDAYADLSNVLRRFLEQELGFPATAMSSAELSEELSTRACPAPTIARLTQFLSEADEVKFSGRSRPHLSLTDSPAACVREIVQQVHQMSLANDQEE